jgi:hypothetical protein
MKFKDLPSGEIFTYWGTEQHHTGIKTGERQAYCFRLGDFVNIPPNKIVGLVERIPEDLTLKFGHEGQAYLCKPMAEGKNFAYRILLIGGEIMEEKDLKPSKVGGEGRDFTEVYITINLLKKRMESLENALRTVKTAIEESLSFDPSDNKIMSTSNAKRLGVLTE